MAAMDYIEEVLVKRFGRISTSLERAHIWGIIEDSPISDSSFPLKSVQVIPGLCRVILLQG